LVPQSRRCDDFRKALTRSHYRCRRLRSRSGRYFVSRSLQSVKKTALVTTKSIGTQISDKTAFRQTLTITCKSTPAPMWDYKSNEGGEPTGSGSFTWDDTIQTRDWPLRSRVHQPASLVGALVIGGNQDNGIREFRTASVFYHGGLRRRPGPAIDRKSQQLNPHLSQLPQSPMQVGPEGIERSVSRRKFGTYSDISSGLTTTCLVYPPWIRRNQFQQNRIWNE